LVSCYHSFGKAFHRTSIIMQYANARILLLLQRRHWHTLSASALSTSGILLWGLATLMCLRMLLGEKMPFLELFTKSSTKRKTISSTTTTAAAETTTLKPLPSFWKNGNSYCFVLPMIVGVCADFGMSAWCEHCYFSSPHTTSHGDGGSLFDYYSDHWLSLWHLMFLQVVAHVIAFAFTLVFRIKHLSKTKETKPNNLVRRFYTVQTLYWVCTTGVYALLLIGLFKARTTLRVVG